MYLYSEAAGIVLAAPDLQYSHQYVKTGESIVISAPNSIYQDLDDLHSSVHQSDQRIHELISLQQEEGVNHRETLSGLHRRNSFSMTYGRDSRSLARDDRFINDNKICPI